MVLILCYCTTAACLGFECLSRLITVMMLVSGSSMSMICRFCRFVYAIMRGQSDPKSSVLPATDTWILASMQTGIAVFSKS